MDCVFFSETGRKVITGYPFCYDFHGIFIQNSGQAKISIDNESLSLDRGCFIFLRANQVREWVALTPDFSGYLLIFENEFTETFFNDDLFVHRFQFFQVSQPAVLRCSEGFLSEHVESCRRIGRELDNLQDDSHHYLRSLLYNMLISINRKYIKSYNLSSELYQDNISLRFRKSLEENIRNTQRVEDYSNLLKVSRSQLNKAINKTSGKSTSVIIRERLLTEIKRDLLYSDKNISEIAYELGFSDNSNFVRFFKKQTGLTPNDFRSINAK
ncbi:AraC family transcriptional activator of pobA [Flagellimonas meridianipacifica]|uniref:AraC family transcriptional activator of pobA n=2 Tax=Flagellimonas meridianipacifica TaxID=1080225 RepID=A0A2T0MBR0_9FLAO|nr:AraC family transcriptional activator of pobA [Allomuricauda pacifica]